MYQLLVNKYISFGELGVGGGWWCLSCDIRDLDWRWIFDLLNFEIEVGDGPGPELDKSSILLDYILVDLHLAG